MASRETIQISLGPSANAVTAHLTNLQGLAATTESDEFEYAACDSRTTHTTEGNVLVPRVLMIDEPTRFPIDQQAQHQQPQGFWDPQRIEVLDSSWSRQYHDPSLQHFLQTTASMAYSPYSRYYQQPQQDQFSYKIDSSNSRHVNWDEEDDEEEEYEDPADRSRRLQQQRFQWQNQTQKPMQEQLSTLWHEAMASSPTAAGDVTQAGKPDTPEVNLNSVSDRESTLSWIDYWMPPYSPRKSILALPFSTQTQVSVNWDSYHQAASTSGTEWVNWKQDDLSDKVRNFLEESDSCQGFTITTEGYGCYAGLATSLLQEIQEECRSAGRMVFHVVDSSPFSAVEQSNGTNQHTDENQSPTLQPSSASSPSWHSSSVERVRKQVQSGIALAGLTQNAHAVLPLKLGNVHENKAGSNSPALFRASANVALGLESVTLPYRFRASMDDPRYKVGLQNVPFVGDGGGGSNDDSYFRWGTTASRLSFGEFLTSVQPASQYKMLELDMMGISSGTTSRPNLWDSIVSGTSVERDQRMRDDGRDSRRFRQRDVMPGGWLQDSNHGGLLSPLSASSSDPKFLDRSLHHHFAVATSVRPNTEIPERTDLGRNGISQYLTCIAEGVGVRYRPERSICTVLNQSCGKLVHGGYGAGTYWESILGSSSESPSAVSVLGNTTRVYPHLHRVATDLRECLGRSSRLRGLYNRDVMNGMLPEDEDCEEALATCFDIRDVYQPPDGSGLLGDNDSSFYDDAN